MSLGSGRLQRATHAFFGTTPETGALPALTVPPATPAPSVGAEASPRPAPPSAQAPANAASPPLPSATPQPSARAPARAAREVPAVRFEDLAIDEPDQALPAESEAANERARPGKVKNRTKR
jgi:hypothetical protein